MKKFYMLLMAMCVAIVANAEDWYVIGSFNNWTTSDPATKMTETSSGVYEISFDEFSTNFKFNTGDWTGSQFGAGSGQVKLGETYELSDDGSSGNINLEVDAISNAHLKLDVNAKTLVVTGTPKAVVYDWYMPGLNDDWNPWDTGNYKFSATETDGVYVLTAVEIPAATQFKIATAGWAKQYGFIDGVSSNIQWGNFSTTLGEVSYGGDVTCGVTGTWDITWNLNDLTVTFVQNTGVDAIAADDANAPVEYFNLQGVRVDNPANGLYITRQGSKVSKVVVK